MEKKNHQYLLNWRVRVAKRPGESVYMKRISKCNPSQKFMRRAM